MSGRRQDDPTGFVRDHYDRSASRYDRMIRLPERLLFADGRQWATRQAQGDVLEIAVGTGRNLPHYATGLHLVGVDISIGVLALARARANEAGVHAELSPADAQHLPFPDASFDTVVATLALCSIPDDTAAVREIARVLRPGGAVLLLEHVRSTWWLVRAVQRLLEPLLLRTEGDHLLREPEKRVQQAGLQITELERSRLGLVLRLRAVKPLAP